MRILFHEFSVLAFLARKFHTHSGANACCCVESNQQSYHPGVKADDDWRNQRFKIFTKVAKGPLAVRLATPQRPALSGRSVPHRYYTSDKYVEVDMDVSKDPTAARALKIVKPASKLLVVDLGFILEGRQEDELPEMVFGAARLNNFDISDANVPLAGHIDWGT